MIVKVIRRESWRWMARRTESWRGMERSIEKVMRRRRRMLMRRSREMKTMKETLIEKERIWVTG